MANRRLFSVVREERQLTYDASFQTQVGSIYFILILQRQTDSNDNASFQGHEATLGGWYLVSVTSSPAQVQDAIRACKEALFSLKAAFGNAIDFLSFVHCV